jgi:hypothetical protein
MLKVLTAALAIGGAVLLTASAPASAASRHDGIYKAAQTDLSAARRHRRRHARARVYTYPTYGGVNPYGYYGPTYYDRPYSRPAPLFFGFGGGW